MSKVIKSQWAGSDGDEQKVISIRTLKPVQNEDSPADVYQFDNEKRKILARAKTDAEKILQTAELKAQSIRDQIANEQSAWEQEKKSLVEQAKQQGFSHGHAEGKEQGYKEYRETILSAQDVVKASKKDYQAKIDSSEQTILDLGIKVAEKIMGMKLAEDEQGFLSLVKRALKEVHKYREIQLLVYPGNYEFILDRRDELAAIFPKETNIYIYPDDECSEGNCIIETAGGRMDASVDSQLTEVKRQLYELLERDSQ